MTLQQLEYILAVNQFRHFAKAAEYCRVTQPTLSAMIQKLEEELDTRIFDRSQQPVCPTPVGIHIIEQAQNILVQANRIKNIIEEEKHSLTGTFKLGILPTVAPYLLPRFFPQLMKKYPDLDIRVVEMKTNDIKKALQTGEIDAGIVASLAGMEELQQTPLFYEQFFAYVSREDALFNNEVIRTSDLNGEQLWLLDEGHCFRDQLVRFCQMKSARASQLAYHLGSMETFMRMVESGIPKDSIKKIWERFYKTDLSRGKDKKGTGLGLSIVKEIVQAHGENINCISTEGVGTEFIFTLPLAKKLSHQAGS